MCFRIKLLHTLIVGGDFNLAGINWENMEITGHSDIRISIALIDCIQQHNLHNVRLVEKISSIYLHNIQTYCQTRPIPQAPAMTTLLYFSIFL